MTQNTRVSRRRLSELQTHLTLCDFSTLRLLFEHRFLASRQVAQLVHSDATTELAGFRAAQRQLRRLETLSLIGHLPRKVGGYGGGQAQTVWHLVEAGHRLLALNSLQTNPSLDASSTRHRFREPSMQFLAHTLKVADVRVVLENLSQRVGGKELTMVQTEPDCWRDWVDAYGAPAVLKPDLYVELADQNYDYFYFIEVDLGTEHTPTIARKAEVYRAYYQTGREQAKHEGIFPLVLWIAPDDKRAERIMETIRGTPPLNANLHRATTYAHLADCLSDTG